VSNIALSVNLNKIALIRNSRPGNNPNLLDFAQRCLDYGAAGITVHPRPDQRHIRPEDCQQLKHLVSERKANSPSIEFNIEGNPAAMATPNARADFNEYPGFIEIVRQCLPDQATLVPDNDAQLTSDHGFNLLEDASTVAAYIQQIKSLGVRVSLFMDPDLDQISRARDIGADRIELYTGPFAEVFLARDDGAIKKQLDLHVQAAEHAQQCGLGLNAGHDLTVDNLSLYKTVPHLLEVSIGHGLTIDSLELGLEQAVKAYVNVLR